MEASVADIFRIDGPGQVAFLLEERELFCQDEDEASIRLYGPDGSVRDWHGPKQSSGRFVVEAPLSGPHLLVKSCIFGSLGPAGGNVRIGRPNELVQSEVPDEEWLHAYYQFTWPDDTLVWEPYAGGFQTTWQIPLDYLGGYCCIFRPPYQGSVELLRPDGSRYAYINSVNDQWVEVDGIPSPPYPPEVTVRVSTVCCGANWTIRTIAWDAADFEARGMQPPDRAKYATDLKVEYVP